jgi:hypothetical protein
MIKPLLAGFMLVTAIVIYRSGRELTFHYDEWNFVLGRQGWNFDTFLVPHNEHLLLIPVAVFKVLFVTVGLDAYRPYLLVPLGLHLLCVWLVFVYVRRRRGELVAFVASVLLLVLGAAWHALLVPLNLSFLASVAAGLGALIALERHDGRGDAAACGLLAIAFASSSIGISFAAGALVEILWQRSRWRRVWAVALPIALYAAWFLAYGNPDAAPGAEGGAFELARSNLPAVPGYVFNAAAAASGGLVGLSIDWGRPLVFVAGLALAVKLMRGTPFSPRSLGLLAAAATYWGIMALFRAQLNTPADSRYLYFGGVLIILLVVELMPAILPRREVLVVAAVLLTGSAVSGFSLLHDGSLFLQSWSRFVRAELAALEVAGPTTNPGYLPDPSRAPGISAGPYFAVVSDLGSPAFEAAEVERLTEPERSDADAVLIEALPVSIQPHVNGAAVGPRPRIDVAQGGRVAFRPGCVTFDPTTPAARLELTLPAGGIALTVSETVEVRLRSFAEGFPQIPLGGVEPGSRHAIRIPFRADRTWHLRLTPATRLTACGLRAEA